MVFTFHGVAGDYLPVQADAHEALLGYLEQHKTSVWTGRCGTVASYVKAQHKQLSAQAQSPKRMFADDDCVRR